MKKYSLAIIFVLLLGGGAAAAYLLSEQPVVVIDRALRRFAAADSAAIEMTFGADAPSSLLKESGFQSEYAFLPIIVKGFGYLNMPTDAKPSAWAAFSILGIPGGDGKGAALFELKALENGKAFMKFDNLPAPKGSEAIVSTLNGAWLSTDAVLLGATLIGVRNVAVEPGDRTVDAVATWKRLRRMVTDGDLYAIKERMGSELVDGDSVWRYALVIRPEPLGELMIEVERLVRGEEIGEDRKSEIRSLAARKEVSMAVWIDKKSGDLRKVDLTIRAEKGGDGEERSRPVNVIMTFGEYGRKFEPVEAPPSSQPFRDFVTGLRKL